MTASTLLMKLIATDDKPFDEQIQKENRERLQLYLQELKQGTKRFDAIKYLANALNYVHGFNKNGLIEDNLEAEHAAAAQALTAAAARSPWKATQEECEAIQVILDVWSEIIEQASAKLIREIQHEMDSVCPEAKTLKQVERSRVSKRSHRKPKKKTKK